VLTSALRSFKFPVRPWLFTIKSLGGWASVDKRFFDPKTGIVTRIQKETG
jgi:ABC-type sulfate transport system substrate-binding protein